MGCEIKFKKKSLEKLCSRKNSAAGKFDERNLRIENLKIKIWTQNFRIKIKENKKW